MWNRKESTRKHTLVSFGFVIAVGVFVLVAVLCGSPSWVVHQERMLTTGIAEANTTDAQDRAIELGVADLAVPERDTQGAQACKSVRKTTNTQADTGSEEEETREESETATDEVQSHPAHYTWSCGKDYGGIAPEDGSLSEWAPHYYVAHCYGSYGKAILGLESGDTIVVNGSEVTVQGAVVMRLGSAYEDVMSAVGWDATVFQTCIPDTGDCRFVFARGASSTEQAAREARQWVGLDIERVRQHDEPEFFDNVPREMGPHFEVGRGPEPCGPEDRR